jgi:hypothetical protein
MRQPRPAGPRLPAQIVFDRPYLLLVTDTATVSAPTLSPHIANLGRPAYRAGQPRPGV